MAFPPLQAQIATAKLVAIFVSMDFSTEDMLAIIKKLAKRYQAVYTSAFVHELRRTLVGDKRRCITRLRDLVGRLIFS